MLNPIREADYARDGSGAGEQIASLGTLEVEWKIKQWAAIREA